MIENPGRLAKLSAVRGNPTEIDQLSEGLTIWHRFDPEVKADLFSTSVATVSGTYLIDPIEIQKESRPDFGPVSGVIVTNGNHFRAAQSFAERQSVPIHAHPESDISNALPIADGEQLSPDLQAISIEGAAPGEIALHWKSNPGTLIIGDALVNFGSHEFTLLPAKYCSNQKLMRKSLRKLLELSFDRMLFAHGTPIMTNARDRLATLLDASP